MASCIWFWELTVRVVQLTHYLTYRVLILDETLVVPTQAYQKQYTCDVLEAVNPLPPLTLLAADINHHHLMISELENSLCDADCPCTASNDVLLCGNVVLSEEPVQVREEIRQTKSNNH